MNAPKPTAVAVHHVPWKMWALLAIATLIATAGFHTGVGLMINSWFTSEEYSHGVLIPVIAAFLIWQQKDRLERVEFTGSWAGVAVVALGGALLVLGDFSALFALQQYALLVVLYGLVLALTGWRVFRQLAVPLLILVLMIPLPQFLLQNFSAQLQLISSQLGVWFIRLFGISVFVEGNVIDLGNYKLQVADACSGLRYLFPLMTLGFIMAYFYQAALWKRLLLFLSSIPVTIFMNSFRIGTIGVMVEHWGTGMAEGFLHEFQGWAVFMASGALMVGEMALLSLVGSVRRPWRELFSLEFPPPTPRGATRRARPIPASLVVAVALLALITAALAFAPRRVEIVPQRSAFVGFPGEVGAWSGKHSTLEAVYIDALQFDDYLLADYTRNGHDAVNLYVAWYNSQRAGQSAHSPRSCIPGGGWRIDSLQQVPVGDVRVGDVALTANRALVSHGEQRELVYYWFQQRGRIITNEYMVKWYLFWDALTRQRTDGAMVRLVASLRPEDTIEAVDHRMIEFAGTASRELGRYIPD